MKHRLPPWLVLVLLAGVCALVIFGVAAWRMNRESVSSLITRMPGGDAVLLYVDMDALRRAGVLDMLSGPPSMQEPEYRAFVEQTGFDYTRDLDMAMVAFSRNGTYFLLRGRFDWPFLEEYVKSSGGTCFNTFCRTQGSAPERMISFFPLEKDLMGLAVSKDEYAAYALQERRPAPEFTPPQDPLWSFVPGAALKGAGSMPLAVQMFAQALGNPQQLVFSAGPRGDQIELRLDIACRSAGEAAALTAQLREATAQWKTLSPQNSRPGPGDLTGILTAGVFDQKDTHVLGRWPVQRAFLQTLGAAN